MKNTGIVRKIDQLGRVVLPREILKTWGWGFGDSIEFSTGDGEIIIRKYEVKDSCAACGEMKDLVTVGGIQLCKKCAFEAANRAG